MLCCGLGSLAGNVCQSGMGCSCGAYYAACRMIHGPVWQPLWQQMTDGISWYFGLRIIRQLFTVTRCPCRSVL